MMRFLKIIIALNLTLLSQCKTTGDQDSAVMAGVTEVSLTSRSFKFREESALKDRAEICHIETDALVTCWIRTKVIGANYKPKKTPYIFTELKESSDDREDLVTDLLPKEKSGAGAEFRVICTSILPYLKGGSSENEAFSCLNSGDSKVKFD